MKLKNWEFHKDFKLNGVSFDSKEAILKYTDTLAIPVAQFLQEWFSSDQTISIKTSGSTGKPKWIDLQKKHMINSAKVTGDFFELGSGTTALLCLPTEYIAGKMMLVRSMCLGWDLDIVPSSSTPLHGIDKVYNFSAMIPLQLKSSLEEIHKIQKLIVGGGAVNHALEHKIQSISTLVYATYGMTETCTHIAVKKLNHDKWDCFKTLEGIHISQDDRDCLTLNAPHVSNEEIVTNDVVEIISDHEFQWKGRYDNVVNSGGVKLHPEEIEKKVRPYMKSRFFVAGVRDATLGEKLVMIVEGEHQEFSGEIYKNLERYEVPKHIFFVDKFEETDTQKIQRKRTMQYLIN